MSQVLSLRSRASWKTSQRTWETKILWRWCGIPRKEQSCAKIILVDILNTYSKKNINVKTLVAYQSFGLMITCHCIKFVPRNLNSKGTNLWIKVENVWHQSKITQIEWWDQKSLWLLSLAPLWKCQIFSYQSRVRGLCLNNFVFDSIWEWKQLPLSSCFSVTLPWIRWRRGWERILRSPSVGKRKVHQEFEGELSILPCDFSEYPRTDHRILRQRKPVNV